MKNTKVKIIVILGAIKNTILIASVLLSLLILFSDIILNSLLITFVSKLVAIINLYCFFKVNSDKIINN